MIDKKQLLEVAKEINNTTGKFDLNDLEIILMDGSVQNEIKYNKKYIIEMDNGEKWAIPVEIIAINRADQYVSEFENDLGKSMREDTLPLFEKDEYEIENWAKNNMNWDDVKENAELLNPEPDKYDYQDGWVNGKSSVK